MILSVNIDHIATIRNARGSLYPDLLRAALIAKKAGAKIITMHLREDRRHIKDEDVYYLAEKSPLPINFEMALTEEMIEIAKKIKPKYICIVPEKRMEITTEGGLDVKKNFTKLASGVKALKKTGSEISFFIEPSKEMVQLAFEAGADTVELHTGKFATNPSKEEFITIKQTAEFAFNLGLNVHAGHGLDFKSAKKLAKIKEISILHIGHFLITEAIFVGLKEVVSKFAKII